MAKSSNDDVNESHTPLRRTGYLVLLAATLLSAGAFALDIMYALFVIWPAAGLGLYLQREAHKRQDELHASKAQHKAIIDTAVDAIITINKRGIIQSFNPAAEKMLGYSQKEAIGQNISMLMPSPHQQEHDQYLSNYHKTGEKKIIGIGREVEAKRKDGSFFPVELAVSEADHLGLFTGIIRDITERRELERAFANVAVEEMQNIGRELHDGLGQELTGIGMLAKALHDKLEKQSLVEAEKVAVIMEHIRQAKANVRHLIDGVRPVEVEVQSFIPALKSLAQRITDDSGINCSFACTENVVVRESASMLTAARSCKAWRSSSLD